MPLSSMRFLAPILVGLALAQAEPDGAQAAGQEPVAAAATHIAPEDTAPGRSNSSQLDFGHSRWIASKLDQAVEHALGHFDGI